MLFGFKNPTSGDTLNYHIEGWAKRSKTLLLNSRRWVWFDLMHVFAELRDPLQMIKWNCN